VKIYLMQENDYDCWEVIKAFFKKEDAELLQQKIEAHWLLKPPRVWPAPGDSIEIKKEYTIKWLKDFDEWKNRCPLVCAGYGGGTVSISEIEVE
jgi:hypothetical protein